MWKIPHRTAVRRVSNGWFVEKKNFSGNAQLYQETSGVTKPPVSQSPPPKSGSGWKIFGGALFVAVGAAAGTVAYAKANPEFRQQVESNWPVLIPLTSLIYNGDDDKVGKENLPALGGLAQIANKTQILPEPKIQSSTKEMKENDTASSVSDQAKLSHTKKTEIRKEGNNINKRATNVSQDDMKKQETIKRQQEEERAKELEHTLIAQEIEETAEIAAMETILDNVAGATVDATASAITSQASTMVVMKIHTEKLKIALDNSEEVPSGTKDGQWNDVVEAAAVVRESIKVSDADTRKAREELQKLKSVIEEGSAMKNKFQSNKHLIGAMGTLLQMQINLDAAEKEKERVSNEVKMLRQCQDLIHEQQEKFRKELASIVPEVKLGRKGSHLSEDELNAIIAYSYRRIEQYQKQLAEQQAFEQKRTALALEKQKKDDEQMNNEEVLKELERKSSEWAILQENKMSTLRKEHEDEMRVQLRRQAAAHSDHLTDVMRVQEKQFVTTIEQKEIDVRQEERDRYQEKLNSAMAKLRGVEAAIEGRADLEKQNKKSQELWLACETLKQTIYTGKLGGRYWEEQRKPLANEVIAIKEVAGDDNQFVNTIVGNIPEEALSQGVFTEDALRERWDSVQRTCKQVALIDENGGSLFRYFVSYFQALLVFSGSVPPLEDVTIEVDSLNVFKIVAFTTYYVEKGDFEQALKYANQLKGMSRKVASDWLKDVQLLLETSQVASILSAQASAAGLGGLHIQ